MSRINYRNNLLTKAAVEIEDLEVNTGGIKTRYLTAGKGETVVLLHGAAGGAVNWFRLIGPLAEHFQVIAPDVVGYGETDKPNAAYDRPYFSNWLKNFFAALAIKQTNIVGSSQGGAIAAQFTLDNPQRVKKLVLLNAAAMGEMPLSFWKVIMYLWQNTFPSKLLARLIFSDDVYDKSTFDPDLLDYFVEVQKKEGGGRVAWQGKGQAVSPMRDDDLAGIETETLFLWGREDRLCPLQHAERAHKLMEHSRLQIIEQSSHLPYLDQPEKTAQAIVAFLKGKK